MILFYNIFVKKNTITPLINSTYSLLDSSHLSNNSSEGKSNVDIIKAAHT
jgi:hypothetical protein